MSKRAEEDFRELELYLKQAQEEIGETIRNQTGPIVDSDGLTASDGPDRSQSECDQMLDDLEDILCNYDNMEFYSSKSLPGHTNCKEPIQQKGFEGKKGFNAERKVPEQVHGDNKLKKDVSRKGSDQKHSLSSNSTLDLHLAKRTHERDTRDHLLSRSCESSGLHVSLPHSKPDKKQGMDHLKKHNHVHKVSTKNLPNRLTKSEILHQNDSDNLETDSYVIANEPVIMSTQKKSAAKPTDNLKDENCISDTLSKLLPKSCPTDSVGQDVGSKLDTVDGHDPLPSKTNKKIQDEQVEGMDVKFEINDLIEKINESIDELIGPRNKSKEKETDSTRLESDSKRLSGTNISTNKRKSKEMEMDTRLEINSKRLSDTNIIINKCNDKSDVKEIDSKNQEKEAGTAETTKNAGDDVVETDFGYFWVASSIDEKVNVHRADSTESVQTLKRLSGSIADSTESVQAIKRLSGSVANSTESVQAIKRLSGSVADSTESVQTPNSLSGSDKCETEDINSTHSDGMGSNSNISLNDSCEHPDDSTKGDTGMTTSAPNFLSLDRTMLKKHRLSRHDSSQSISDENLPKVLKRKYSAPPSFCRVYKVVSVDIPKMQYSNSLKKHCRFGDASKVLKSTKSKHTSSERSSIENIDSVYVPCKMEIDDSLDNKMDIEGMKPEPVDSELKLQPPPMFQDSSEKTVELTNIDTGPILAPPPAFASKDAMDATTTSAPPQVWDPGVAAVTTDEKQPKQQTPPSARPLPSSRLPQTPPPPSAHSTERLISSTLSRHKPWTLSGELNISLLKPPGSPRPRSADSAISDRAKYDLNGNEKQNDKIIFRRSDTSDLHTSNQKRNYLKMNKASNYNVNAVDEKDNTFHHNFKALKLKGDLNKQKVDLINQCNHPGKMVNKSSKKTPSSAGSSNTQRMCVSMGTNTTDSLDGKGVHIKTDSSADKNTSANTEKSAENHSSPIYATVNKSAKEKHSNHQQQELAKKLNGFPDTNIPQLPPKSLPAELDDNKTDSASETDQSPEFQVMFNSLSPVLMRRRSSKTGRKGGSVETSPESTPSISPRLDNQDKAAATNHHKSPNAQNPKESLFMDPAMAQTWHGVTSSNWSNIYGPQLRAMLKDLEKEDQSYEEAINKCAETFERNSKTLPSKSLLDEMHKKFCADQYLNSKDADIARALVLLRLKSPTPGKPRRSQSFNIRMGMGLGKKVGPQATAESSPMLPRVSERIRIKTRPDFQYSPKPRRAITPEPTSRLQQDQCSRREEAEIEAIEACRWLRETGFPQYAQLYEDGQFPVDIESVEKDHDFLDKEDIQSLFRRLNTLNKCAIMKIGTPAKKEAEDSDEEDQCALSDKWKYQRSSRRWSRKDLDSPLIETSNGHHPALRSASSHDSLLADQNSSSETGDSPVLDSKMYHLNDDNMVVNKSSALDANGNMGFSPVIRRAASERIKGAKSFLKRMESLKGKRNKKPKTITEISSPMVVSADMQAKIKHLNCKDIDTGSAVASGAGATAIVSESELHGSSISANSVELPSSQSGAVTVVSPGRTDKTVTTDSLTTKLDKSAESPEVLLNGAHGLDISTLSRQSNSSENTNSSEETLFTDYRPGRFPTKLDDSLFIDHSNIRHRSFSYTDENSALQSKNPRRGSHDPRHQMHRISIYDNVPIEEDLSVAQQELDIILSELFQNINGLNKAINGEDAELLEPPVSGIFDDTSLSVDSQTPENEPSTDAQSDVTHEPDENEVISGTLSSPDISDHELHHDETSHDDSAEHIVCRERRDSGVDSSLTRTNSDRRKYRIRWHSFQKSHRPTSENRNLQLCNLSAGQILLLRKLSLLKLTALIEKYSPNRTGWSLTVPRFMKRNKAPDYKDKNVFGVPFSVMIQRTGQALPQCILHAMRYLRRTAEDALGIFRKSGVRSRIQKLRNDIEANPEAIDFEELQAYDVADLVKQYFRELPECLLTNKLSDMFISIFIYVPVEYRLEALQAAVVLMADENRNVLQSLLLFLSDIAKQHSKHQMTASNLAVCFAPSLFMGNSRYQTSSPSPRRNRKNTGIPDARELMEQKAAHECLTLMIQECKKIFTIPAGTLSKCRVWHGDPLSLEELSRSVDGNQGYTGYIDSCIQGLLKESREKFRGWISVPVHLDVDVAYKKVGDGHPLRLWKCTVEVEAPPTEVLNRVLKDRQTWDEDLLQWHTVDTLDAQTEVFQYVRNSMAPHPTRDYCVLRSWRTDLPKGACVLISMSIEHPDAELKGGLTAVELASRYLIEPCGTGKSRLTHISRVDLKGHSPDWYKKVYGHMCANFVYKIRASFHTSTDGPETKV